MLNIIDEFTRECLTIRIGRKLKAVDVIDTLSDLFILRGVPGHIRSDNGPEFVAKAVREWITAVGAKTAYIMPGSPWENGYCECFNSKLRDELLNGEIFYTLEGGKGRHRELAATLQHSQTALSPWLSSTRATGNSVAGYASRTSFAGHAGPSPSPEHALTFKPDHPLGPPCHRLCGRLRPATVAIVKTYKLIDFETQEMLVMCRQCSEHSAGAGSTLGGLICAENWYK